MQVITYLTAVVQRFISHDEFLPAGESSLAPFIDSIIESYEFQAHGDLQTAQANIGAPVPGFQTGMFTYKGKRVPVLSLELHSSKISAACSTTEQTIAFLDDFIGRMVSQNNFRRPERKLAEFYASSLVIDFGPSFISRIGLFNEIADAINGVGADFITTPMEWISMRFSGTGAKDGNIVNNTFLLEQRGGRPAGTSWLFTQAPLTNDRHIHLLNKVEAAFMSSTSKGK